MTELFALLLAAASPQTDPAPGNASPPQTRCDIGPLHRTFGGTHWLVYACVDGATLVVVADTGNPAGSFHFVFGRRADGTFSLEGEGNGEQAASAAAFEELSLLTPQAIEGLLRDAQNTR
jgi:hypothetical protein